MDRTARIKPFTIYHWDTFDNEVFVVDSADTIEEAEEKVKKKYGSKINEHGADRVEVVDLVGNIIKRYSVS